MGAACQRTLAVHRRGCKHMFGNQVDIERAFGDHDALMHRTYVRRRVVLLLASLGLTAVLAGPVTSAFGADGDLMRPVSRPHLRGRVRRHAVGDRRTGRGRSRPSPGRRRDRSAQRDRCRFPAARGSCSMCPPLVDGTPSCGYRSRSHNMLWLLRSCDALGAMRTKTASSIPGPLMPARPSVDGASVVRALAATPPSSASRTSAWWSSSATGPKIRSAGTNSLPASATRSPTDPSRPPRSRTWSIASSTTPAAWTRGFLAGRRGRGARRAPQDR